MNSNEDMEIIDRPGSYTDNDIYRLTENTANNYFTVKCRVINSIQE